MNRALAGRIMLGVGAVGVAVSLVGVLVGVRLVTEIDRALGRSLALTAEALDALNATLALAEDTVVLLEGTLSQTEGTTRDLVAGIEDGERLLAATADLSENQIAGSLEAVEQALPGLVEAAAVIDRTLSALSMVPFGPEYDPDEPFDASLRSLQAEMTGLPDDVREQAELIRRTGESLGEMRDGTGAIADDLAELAGNLDAAASLLRDYTATATRAHDLVDDSRTSLGLQLRLTRALVVVLGLAMAAGQVVPLGIGWLLLRPEAAAALLAVSTGRPTEPTGSDGG